MKRALIIAVIVIAVAAAVVGLTRLGGNGAAPQYRTAKVTKGDLVETIKATGNLKPIKSVDVGTQVSGRVLKLNVDYNSRVTAGQVVALIDPDSYQAKVDQDRANLQRSQADVEQIRAKLVLAGKELERDRELAGRNLVTGSELDTSVANYNALKAQLRSSQAAVAQTRAALRVSEANLAYTVIKSPVDGVVIARNVNEGQTVVASLAAQSIFVIATDLRQMQVEAAVPEADIGKIKAGQPVSFTVDAFPDLTFQGAVQEVRLSASTVQNVVTYPVIISAPNPDEKLLPSMTASVSIEVARHLQVLRVPNSALRFKPEIPEGQKTETAESETPGTGSNASRHKVFINTEKGLKPIPLTLGINDGSFNEIVSGALQEGQEVVTGVLTEAEAAKTETTNPFMPKMPGQDKKNKRKGGPPPPP